MIQKKYQQIKPESDIEIRFELTLNRKNKTVQVNSDSYNFFLNKSINYDYHLDGSKVYIKKDGRYFIFEEIKSYAGLDGEADGDGVIKSKMPGKILEVCVALDSEVKKGDSLIIMESMKMENTILSPLDGIVTALNVGLNDLVEADQILIEVSTKE
ncbi:MAG: hypothetical protein COB02_03860 [Candidatus Cloacimonadota bacterium]|nr:MAG: hypothetical protein COB02_03860 [Candidatus Cloacimonadota bacterium]